MDARGIDLNDPGWVNRKFQELKREIEDLRSERRAASTTIGEGGSLRVDGGEIVFLDADGSVLLRIGEQQYGDRGFALNRDDGSPAITLSNALGVLAQQELRIRDRFGNEILAEEAFGSGFSTPYLPVPMQPMKSASGAITAGPYGLENTHATTTWTSVFRAQFTRQNQFVTFATRVAASDTTTAAELRVIDPSTGSHLGRFLAGPYTGPRAAGTTTYTTVTLPGIVMLGNYLDTIEVELQIRRTAGTGTLTVAVAHAGGSAL